MNIEVRISDNLKTLDNVPGNTDIIGIGDEGCIHKVPVYNNALEIRKGIHALDKGFRYITPKVPERSVKQIVETIRLLCQHDRNFYLTINDFGIMYACFKNNIMPAHISIGRAISRSFEECLWHEHILRDEDQDVKDTVILNTMFHDVKNKYLKKFNITSIESNMLEQQIPVFKLLREREWGVDLHYGHITVSFSRACQAARYIYKKAPPLCKMNCKGAVKIKMTHKWERGEKISFAPIEGPLEEIKPEFILMGNILYRKNPVNENGYDYRHINTLIFHDNQFENNAMLEEKIEHIKGMVSNA